MTNSRAISNLIEDESMRWNATAHLGTSVVLTYSFGDSQAAYDISTREGIETFTDRHKANVRLALDEWDDASGIDFVEVDDDTGGQLRFLLLDITGTYGEEVAGFAYLPSSYTDYATDTVVQEDELSGDIYLNTDYYDEGRSISPTTYGFGTVLHEIGHAIGLHHPTPITSYSNETVMSYGRSSGSTTILDWDEDAVQYLYGEAEDAPFRAFDEDDTLLTTTGSRGDDWLLGFGHDDVIEARAGDDALFGFEGDDILSGGAGDDAIDGGAGTDTVIYDTARDDSTLTETRDGTIAVDGAEGRDTLRNVESLQFTDTIVFLDDRRATSEEAREIALLYEAALDRDGGLDLPGLNYWIDEREGGRDILDISVQFVFADEFTQAFGALETLSNREIVEIFYRNTLDRDGEAAGIDFWANEMTRPDFDLEDLVYAFAVSEENREGSTYLAQLEEVDMGFWGFS